ncbi:hypothetical protein [Synechococcus sp. PCC 7336]|uniref:hypothetical protein n=1 Tax=Synechococcus sp. PCC 7336 TaxID=195250 RepID=UPI0012EA7859|nr:hypothetical protein [Synechococcus sp. PCC 7336]
MKSYRDTNPLNREVEESINYLEATKRQLPKRILESISISILCSLTLFGGSGNIAAKIAVSVIGPLSTLNAAILSLKLRNESSLNQDLRKLKHLNKSLLYYSVEFDTLSDSNALDRNSDISNVLTSNIGSVSVQS